MWSHLSLGVRDVARSKAFYDAALAPLGQVCVFYDPGRVVAYGLEGQGDKLALFEQADTSERLAAGPGCHLALAAPSREAVDSFYAAALAQGGHDEGPPGLRPHYGASYYAAFVRDPDGHKLEAVHQ